jgi:hypothetical protein
VETTQDGKRPSFANGIKRDLAAVRAAVTESLWIPTEAGRGFRFDVGHRSDLKPATIPI